MGGGLKALRPRFWNRLHIKVLSQHHIDTVCIAGFLGCHLQTVRTWVGRLHHQDCIDDRVRPGAKAILSEDTGQRVTAFFCQFETLPGYARWTLSTACQYFEAHPEYLGEGITISRASVHRLLAAHALKPHRFRYFLQLCDPDFFSKMEHIIEVYATVSENLFCFDECTGIQALESLAPAVPAGPNRAEYREVDYIRHGAVSVFSVLEVRTGQVFTEVIEDHTSATIVDVFKRHVGTVSPTEKLHYICDNYASHSTTEVCETVAELCGVNVPDLPSVADRRRWLGQTDKRIVFHFLPFHGSWLNLIENWFGIMKKNCLDGCSVHSKEALSQNLLDFTNTWNLQYAHPFNWTYDGKNLRGKTVRKFTHWLQEDSRIMTGKFLGKQLQLLSNLVENDWHNVPREDWHRLGSVIAGKQKYLSAIVESINAETFKNTKAKTPEQREIKIENKVERAKQILRERIASFATLIETALTDMLNCEKEVINH